MWLKQVTKSERNVNLALNLPQLQNLMKRDPSSYIEEFNQQWRNFKAQLDLFNLKPQEKDQDDFGNLVMFLAHISLCYKKETESLPQLLVDLLENHYKVLQPELRRSLVQALILLRNKDLIQTEKLLSLFFTLFRCQDKMLRALLHSHIVTDIKNMNAKAKNNKLNKTFQNFMYTMLKDTNEIAARKSLEVMIELYKKNIWNDSKTVNVIAEACFSENIKVVAIAVHFFLGTNDEEKVEEEDDSVDVNQIKHALSINKKTKSKRNKIEKVLAATKRREKKNTKAEIFNFSALHLLNDPQTFADKLFSRLKQTKNSIQHKFELKLQILNLITRLIGIHKLIIFGVYEFVISYIKPAQRDVTMILAYTAQASHELIPPEILTPVIQAIADNFIWSNCSAEVICAGMNSLREICIRCPLAMPEELLQSLISDYKHHKEKGVITAARGLLGLFREINPEMLKKKDRGKSASINIKTIKAPQFGEVKVFETVEGLEELIQKENEEEFQWVDDEGKESDESSEDGWEEIEDNLENEDLKQVEGWEGWEVASDDESDIEEEWIEQTEENTVIEDNVSNSSDIKENVPSGKQQPPKSNLNRSMVYEKILTAKDFKRLKQMKMQKEILRKSGKKEVDISMIDLDDTDDSDIESNAEGDVEINDKVEPSSLLGTLKRKRNYEERLESIKMGREGREKYGSKKNKLEKVTSKTNKEKSKVKNNMMMVHKRSVKGKAKRSLRDKQKTLRAHIDKQKRKGM
ncbi:Protein SDA1 [Lobulomyces angularis]|nr:Protein SDA1 [Lobulomyces angularis]